MIVEVGCPWCGAIQKEIIPKHMEQNGDLVTRRRCFYCKKGFWVDGKGNTEKSVLDKNYEN